MFWMFERAGKKNPRNKDFQFWQQHNHPIELFDNAVIDQKIAYIHQNPVASGMVTNAAYFKYSSANPESILKTIEA